MIRIGSRRQKYHAPLSHFVSTEEENMLLEAACRFHVSFPIATQDFIILQERIESLRFLPAFEYHYQPLPQVESFKLNLM